MKPLEFFDAARDMLTWWLYRDCCARSHDYEAKVTLVGDEILAVSCAACSATWAVETDSNTIHISFDSLLGFSTWSNLSKKKTKKKRPKYKACPRCGSTEEICPC